MYVLGAGSPNHPVPGSMFYRFERRRGSWRSGPAFVHSSVGSLFTHQFSHAFIDFRGTADAEGVDWQANSMAATLANRRNYTDNPDGFRTFGPASWALTACDRPQVAYRLGRKCLFSGLWVRLRVKRAILHNFG